MKPIRVVAVTSLFPLPWDPHRAAYNRQQFQQLAAKHTLSVLVPVSWVDWLRGLRKKRSSVSYLFNIRYFPYIYIPLIGRALHSLFMFLSMLTQIIWLTKQRADVILASWGFPDAVATTAWCKILRIKVIIKVHGSDINMKAQIYSQREQIRWALKNADAVVTVSKALQQAVSSLGIQDEKINVIYNGVDTDSFQPKNHREARKRLGIHEGWEVILYVGNLKEAKGCIDLIRAFTNLAYDNKALHLYYIGQGPAESKIHSQATIIGLDRRIHLSGEVAHNELVHWYNASNLICLPSHNEGVPNVLLEAMACGLPVVATRVGGIPEVVSEQSGILVRHGDIAGLTIALREALTKNWDHPTIVRSMQEFTWDQNVTLLEHLLVETTK